MGDQMIFGFGISVLERTDVCLVEQVVGKPPTPEDTRLKECPHAIKSGKPMEIAPKTAILSSRPFMRPNVWECQMRVLGGLDMTRQRIPPMTHPMRFRSGIY